MTDPSKQSRPRQSRTGEAEARSVDTWSRYRGNFARHLIGISRDLESRVVRSLVEVRGFQGLRPSFGPILSLLWEEGQPLTAIAAELAISKQACSQLATSVGKAGYAERRPHPFDRRSKVVCLTARGRALVEDAVRSILEIESEYRALLGATAYQQMTRALTDLYQGLGLPTHSDPGTVARARHTVGVLPLIVVRIQRELMEATTDRGHSGLKMSHGQVLPLIGDEGGRIFEIARIHGVSRQAISMISQDLEELGYLRREPDPRDRRGVVLRLTEAGEGLIEDSVSALDGVEAAFMEILGARSLSNLKRSAHSLYRSLHLEEEIFKDRSDAVTSLVRADDPSAGRAKANRGDREMEQLASRLREELGHGDATRLAALLEARA
jgi:DNA-binding MarR family transcriptional regulator